MAVQNSPKAVQSKSKAEDILYAWPAMHIADWNTSEKVKVMK